MKNFGKLLSLGALLIASAAAAHASPITGYISFGGTDSFDANQITFNPGSYVTVSSGTLTTPFATAATLTSFTYTSAVGVTLFSVPLPNGISFVINSITSNVYTASVPSEVLKGTGTFSENGYTPTAGTFTLSTTTAGATTLQLDSVVNAAVSPEPSSLILLGTGLLSAAGMVVRKRRAA